MASSSHLLENQVGGHPGVRASKDGSQIIKPCLPTERLFYEKVISSNIKGFDALRKHVPAFYGVVPAEGPEDKEAIILENLSNLFTHPSILDIKLGTVLYDDSASPEKKERMIKTARDTTSLETGVRFTAFTVYDTTTRASINTSKEYGRTLKVANLPEATARFFPIQTPILELSTASTPTEEEEGGGGGGGRGGGHTDITPSPAGTPPDLLLRLLQGILHSTRQLRDAVAQTEMRMVGGSILIIYEGDPDRPRSALDGLKAAGGAATATATAGAGAGAGVGAGGAGAGAGALQDGTLPIPKPSATDQLAWWGVGNGKEGHAFAVKLIDFAHTKLEEGLGPDEGVVLGLDTTISLLEGRIKEVQEALGSA